MKNQVWLPGFGIGRGICFSYDFDKTEICPLTMEKLCNISTRESTSTYLKEHKFDEATTAHVQRLQLKVKDSHPLKMFCGHTFSCFELLHHLSLQGDQCPVCRQGTLRTLNLDKARKPNLVQKELWEFVRITSALSRKERQDERERELAREHEEMQAQEYEESILNWVFEESNIFAVIFAYAADTGGTALPPACFRVGLRLWDSSRTTNGSLTYRAGRSQLRTMNEVLQRSSSFSVRVDMEIDTQLYSLMGTQTLQYGRQSGLPVQDSQNFGGLIFCYESYLCDNTMQTLKNIDFCTTQDKIRTALTSLLQNEIM